MWENLKNATDKNGHPITQNMFDKIEKALRTIIDQYDSMPDGVIGRGLTNEMFYNGRRVLDELDT